MVHFKKACALVLFCLLLAGCNSKPKNQIETALSNCDYYAVISYIRGTYSIDEIYDDNYIREYCGEYYTFDEIYDKNDLIEQLKDDYGLLGLYDYNIDELLDEIDDVDGFYEQFKEQHGLIDPSATDELVEYIVSAYDIEDVEEWYNEY